MLEQHEFLRGRVIDFGAGKQPYKDLVDGEYFPIDRSYIDGPSLGSILAAGPVDAIMCNQVLQYVERPGQMLAQFRAWLRPGGHLVMTYPTNWDEVEASDLWRFTRAGMETLLADARLHLVHHERRAAVELNGFCFPLGYGVVARA